MKITEKGAEGQIMKIILATLNAKYIHVNLAIRSIGKFCEVFSPKLMEYTINDNIDNIIAKLYKEKADVIAFSCYIWNIEKILYIAKTLKSVSPNITFVLGGHEVSYDAKDILNENPYIDYIIRGEGEKPCYALFDALINKKSVRDILSLTYKDGNEIIENSLCEGGDLNEYPFSYDESIDIFKGKIVYYESSRGCPFQCSYCLSGNNTRVNFLELGRVKKELLFFIEHNVSLVKFVDRTFNADKKRASEIFKFIIENKKNTKFHFELAGSLIDDEMLAILKDAPQGLIQFEIGVQSTNERTMTAIGRKIDFNKIKENVSKILELKNIHVHLDLIVGLPYEGYESFKKSFDDVVSIRPHVLQLGFLKLLKGSKIREEEKRFNYKYKTLAPYEIMENDFISFDDIIKLKYIEDIFEKYYNSGDFKQSMDFLFDKFSSPFGIFEKIYDYMRINNIFDNAISLEMRYTLLKNVFKEEGVCDYTQADLLTNPKTKASYELDLNFKDACFKFLKNERNIEKYLPQCVKLAPKIIYKRLRFQRLFGGVYMYDTTNEKLVEITSDF